MVAKYRTSSRVRFLLFPAKAILVIVLFVLGLILTVSLPVDITWLPDRASALFNGRLGAWVWARTILWPYYVVSVVLLTIIYYCHLFNSWIIVFLLILGGYLTERCLSCWSMVGKGLAIYEVVLPLDFAFFAVFTAIGCSLFRALHKSRTQLAKPDSVLET